MQSHGINLDSFRELPDDNVKEERSSLNKISISDSLIKYQQQDATQPLYSKGELHQDGKTIIEKPNDVYNRYKVFSNEVGSKKLEGRFKNDVLNQVFALPNGLLSVSLVRHYQNFINYLDNFYDNSRSFKIMVESYSHAIDKKKAPRITTIIPKDMNHSRDINDIYNGSPQNQQELIAPKANIGSGMVLIPENIFSGDDQYSQIPHIFMDSKTGKTKISNYQKKAILMHEIIHVLAKSSDEERIKQRASSRAEVSIGNRASVDYTPVDFGIKDSQQHIEHNKYFYLGESKYLNKDNLIGETVPLENSIMAEYSKEKGLNYDPRVSYAPEEVFYRSLYPGGEVGVALSIEEMMSSFDELLEKDRSKDGVVDYLYQPFDALQTEQQIYDIDFHAKTTVFPPDYFDLISS